MQQNDFGGCMLCPGIMCTCAAVLLVLISIAARGVHVEHLRAECQDSGSARLAHVLQDA